MPRSPRLRSPAGGLLVLQMSYPGLLFWCVSFALWHLAHRLEKKMPLCPQNTAFAYMAIKEALGDSIVTTGQISTVLLLQGLLGVALPLWRVRVRQLSKGFAAGSPAVGKGQRRPYTPKLRPNFGVVAQAKLHGIDPDDVSSMHLVSIQSAVSKASSGRPTVVRVFEGQSVGWRVCRLGTASLPRSSTNPGAS